MVKLNPKNKHCQTSNSQAVGWVLLPAHRVI